MRTAEAPFALPGMLTLDRLRAGVELGRRTGLPILARGNGSGGPRTGRKDHGGQSA